ncbi:AAA family ATPase [uncultured Gimesia sp.]|uniref:ExeA family protein n=1 Tax=uncultured Gimesia sp. TaxID=1678688 RepID=UPI0030DDCC41|tara:strand:- start:10173 stop:12062 length:1890 start_codon:yes stop_codon:yes gene_type:complete
MYETNFGFKDRPFTVSPSPACFYQATEHQNVLDELLVSISSLNGITILTGEAGTGKTAICRQLISQLEEQFQIQFVEHCNFPTVRALLQTLLYSLTDCYEKVSEQELRLALSAEIRSSFLAHGQPLLLIVDEAHLLPVSFLEELRVLSDISFDGKPALQLMLCGQTALEETLVQSALSSLNQRIGCQAYLDRMTRLESEEYIAYRIQRVATEEREYFTEEAVKFITQVSDGLPRCLNQICDHSLMLAYLQDSPVVDEAITREAFTDLQQLPLHWNDPLPARSPLEEMRESEPVEKIDQMLNEEETATDYDIDTSMEDQLNELASTPSSETESATDDFDWDSSDLLSLGDDIEAIEIGDSSEENEVCETEVIASESEPELEPAMPPLSIAETFTEVVHNDSTSSEQVSSFEITDGFVEIVDRYAAIDAGVDPATLPQETLSETDVMSSSLRLQPPPFRAAVPQQDLSSKQSIAPPVQPAVAVQSSETDKLESSSDVESNPIVFEESQLKRLEPNVFQALADEISQDDGSFEELLAAQVYEVCSETRRGLLNALNEIRNYSESQETEAVEEEPVAYDMVEPEFEPPSGTSFRLDSQTEQGTQNAATSHLKGPALGRYKNLFTRLRRKQDSL